MRESIGGAWILGIVMTFIVLFASFLAISINYSKAFKVKNNVVDLIEKNEGMNESAAEDIWGYLQSQGYILKGKCRDAQALGFDKDGVATNQNQSLYFVKRNKIDDTALNKTYYSVEVFFRLDLPVVGDIFTFSVTGETMSIYFAENDPFGNRFNAKDGLGAD